MPCARVFLGRRLCAARAQEQITHFIAEPHKIHEYVIYTRIWSYCLAPLLLLLFSRSHVRRCLPFNRYLISAWHPFKSLHTRTTYYNVGHKMCDITYIHMDVCTHVSSRPSFQSPPHSGAFIRFVCHLLSKWQSQSTRDTSQDVCCFVLRFWSRDAVESAVFASYIVQRAVHRAVDVSIIIRAWPCIRNEKGVVSSITLFERLQGTRTRSLDFLCVESVCVVVAHGQLWVVLTYLIKMLTACSRIQGAVHVYVAVDIVIKAAATATRWCYI